MCIEWSYLEEERAPKPPYRWGRNANKLNCWRQGGAARGRATALASGSLDTTQSSSALPRCLCFCSRRSLQHQNSSCVLFRLFLLIHGGSPVSSLRFPRWRIAQRAALRRSCHALAELLAVRRGFAALLFTSSSRLSINRSARKCCHYALSRVVHGSFSFFLSPSLSRTQHLLGSQAFPLPSSLHALLRASHEGLCQKLQELSINDFSLIALQKCSNS